MTISFDMDEIYHTAAAEATTDCDSTFSKFPAQLEGATQIDMRRADTLNRLSFSLFSALS
jgi:hypothetical protein